jgi:hypothetical protein
VRCAKCAKRSQPGNRSEGNRSEPVRNDAGARVARLSERPYMPSETTGGGGSKLGLFLGVFVCLVCHGACLARIAEGRETGDSCPSGRYPGVATPARERIVMPIDVAMAYGSHHRIAQSVTNVRVSVIAGPEVELVASIVPDPIIRNPSHLQATSVAIHMDQAAAGVLFARLRETFQTRGWPLPPEGESPV